jgi:hypothetical protein
VTEVTVVKKVTVVIVVTELLAHISSGHSPGETHWMTDSSDSMDSSESC